MGKMVLVLSCSFKSVMSTQIDLTGHLMMCEVSPSLSCTLNYKPVTPSSEMTAYIRGEQC
jgi:hypothetical protein